MLSVLRKALAKLIGREEKRVLTVKTPLGYVTVDCRYEIPYLAGYSKFGKKIPRTVYIDRRLPRWRKLKNGQVIDNYKYIIIHEVWEWIYEKYGYKYPYAHEKSTGEKERPAVIKDKIKWNDYQNFMRSMSRKLKNFSTSLPKDLDIQPEKDTHDYYRLHKIERLKQGKLNEKEKNKNGKSKSSKSKKGAGK